jgi:class 3 adenylate cyclase/tetratricopeptide (TPR) repeat protein
VTVVFADLSGSTGLAERLDPEDLRRVLGSFFEAMSGEVASQGGTIDKYIGDAVMAVFGAPVAHDDDAGRALRAALAMRTRVAQINDRLAGELGARMGLHVGVNTGEVVAGSLAVRAQSAYTIVGDTVHLAQRLQSMARDGEILVGPITRRAAQRGFDFDDLAPIQVKGRSARVAVSRLLSERRLIERVGSPLVGRENEVAALLERVREVGAGHGGIVSVIGEAGVGKSRLIVEARDKSASMPVRWLEGRALSTGQAVPYLPLIEIMRRDIGLGDAEDETAAWSKLDARVHELFPDDADDAAAYLGSILTLRLPDGVGARVGSLSADAMGRQVLRVARRYFERVAQELPLVLVIEDVHWLDESSAVLLEHLLPLVREVPLLVCGVSRPELDTAAARLHTLAKTRYADVHREIRVAPLSAQASDLLTTNLLGQDAAAHVRDAIRSKSEGNPFYIEEVVRAFIDAGGLVRNESTGAWTITSRIEQIAIPDTIQGVIMARLDRLDDEVRQVVKTASVVGRSFWLRVLTKISDETARIDQQLDTLTALDLIRERRRVPELEYAFKHVLTQQTAYDSLLIARRRELHGRVGAAIEALFSERLEEFAGVLAYHYARAENWEKAQEYLFKVGDQAGRLAADAEALGHYHDAMAAYQRAFGDRWDPLRRAALERKIGEALFGRGEHEAAGQYMRRSLAYLGTPFPGRRAGVTLAIGAQLVLQAFHRIAPRLFVAPIGRPVAPLIEERLRVYESMAWMDYYVAKDRLFLEALLHLNVSERVGYAPGMVAGYFGLAFVCSLILATMSIAPMYHRRALALATKIGQPGALAYANLGPAIHEHRLGQFESALEHWSRAADHFWQAGELRRWAGAAWGTAWVLLTIGHPERCQEKAEEIIRVGRDGSDQLAWGWGLHIRGRYLWQTGELEAAEVDLRQSIELLAKVPDYPNLAAAYGDLGQTLMRQGRLAEARESLDRSVDLMSRHRLRGYLGTIKAGHANVLLALAEASAGHDRTALLRAAERALAVTRAQCRMDREARAWLHRLEGTYAWLRGRPADAVRKWELSLAAAEEFHIPYEQGLTLMEWGTRLNDRGLLDRAEHVLTRLGAAHELARIARRSST